ncbi:CAP domain-containing protein [Trinickia violacea]|uniref:CAP domain-containing protein n=2 Tax=Trinickia violacea TaxID=2571746 RepID=A0A4P8J3R5_9BURK|nr:CAP domain-containing protein [Trinickia violacea]
MLTKNTTACIAAIAALAGCATYQPTAGEPTAAAYTGPPITLREVHGAHTRPAIASTAHRSAIDFINARRAEVGLPAIARDSHVAAAAADHARYLDLNHSGTHDELAGNPGFTGVDVISRVRLHTPAYGASEVLAVYGGPRGVDSPIEEIFASPYHRGAIFFDWARAGEARVVGASAITVVDFADIAPALSDTQLVAYPYDGQRDAPIAWTDNEQPDPMGPNSGYQGQTLGFPITLSGGPSAHIELTTVDVRDGRGHRVRCHIAALTSADTARNTAICTPFEPLRPGVHYIVRATGRLTQRNFANAPFNLEWGFTTSVGKSGAAPILAQTTSK